MPSTFFQFYEPTAADVEGVAAGGSKPEIAIYSAEPDSRYGNPHQEVDRLGKRGIRLYGTPGHGTIRVVTDGSTYSVHTERAEAGETAPGRVDINTAGLEELREIVHIGEPRARGIIKLRPFSSIEELTGVSGIGPARLFEIREQWLMSETQLPG